MSGIPCVTEGCDGIAVPTQKDGRFYEHREVIINVPKDFAIPKCQKCGTDVFDEALYKALVQILEKEYQRDAAMIAECRERFKART